MRKVMLLAAVMAMVLAAAAPAFAQATAVGGSVQYVDCDQIQAAATGQYNVENDQEALAALAQELGVDQNQVLACFRSIAAGRDVNINTASASTVTVTAKATSTSTAKAGGGGGGGSASAASAAGGSLPSTGGASLLALGAGALLVAGGLLARRIVR
jgi:alanyl-tRNA synthetase